MVNQTSAVSGFVDFFEVFFLDGAFLRDGAFFFAAFLRPGAFFLAGVRLVTFFFDMAFFLPDLADETFLREAGRFLPVFLAAADLAAIADGSPITSTKLTA